MENTFWGIKRDEELNFVELFKKSFTLYVESGMAEMTEKDIGILRSEQEKFSPQPASARTKDFNAKFYKFVVDHYLRKLHCFFLFAFDTSNHCLRLLNTAHPGEFESRAGEEQLQVEASGGGAFALERKNEKKSTWLQKFKLKLKSVGDKGQDGA